MKSFLTGLATGLAIGYLTAPRSGKETRDQLAEAANKQTEGLKGQWEKTTAQVNKLIDDVKSQAGLAADKASVFADQANTKFDQYKDEATQAADQYKDQYNDKVDQTADAAKEGVDQAEEALKY